ncbi:uncharacterized protein VTP21DRAFT_3319 [Calcarisporiella thermophila]|uniref:uncharacterized protein n=1 Tax=Calcarisporiella thermophila TaxID=911321 RepID=UPI0037432216
MQESAHGETCVPIFLPFDRDDYAPDNAYTRDIPPADLAAPSSLAHPPPPPPPPPPASRQVSAIPHPPSGHMHRPPPPPALNRGVGHAGVIHHQHSPQPMPQLPPPQQFRRQSSHSSCHSNPSTPPLPPPQYPAGAGIGNASPHHRSPMIGKYPPPIPQQQANINAPYPSHYHPHQQHSPHLSYANRADSYPLFSSPSPPMPSPPISTGSNGSAAHRGSLFNIQYQQPLVPCPSPECPGENSTRAKFCGECGRSLLQPQPQGPPGGRSPLMRPISPYSQQQPQQQLPQLPHGHPGQQAVGSETSHGYLGPNSMQPSLNDTNPRLPGPHTSFYSPDYSDVQKPGEIQDPLGRGRGCPLLAFGFGGKMVTYFPSSSNHQSPYSPSFANRAEKVQLRRLKDIIVSPHPPLLFLTKPLVTDEGRSAKSNKKEVARFLDERIELEGRQDKRLLWQALKIMVESNGVLAGSEKSEAAIRDLLVPALDTSLPENFTVPADHPTDLQANGSLGAPAAAPTTNHVSTTTTASSPVRVETSDLDILKRHLLRGDRRGAVNYAMQEDMWPHAMIISSCMDKEAWKEVVLEFTRREMSVGGHAKHAVNKQRSWEEQDGLRVLYGLFSGLGSQAVMELLPRPPRPLFTSNQSDSPASTPPACEISSEKLANWREIVALILANHTAKDSIALTALGDLLASKGLIPEAHLCYILSPQTSPHAGLGAPGSRFVLLGGDHKWAKTLSLDQDAFCMEQIYEFALCLHNGDGTLFPHLLAYKLHHAWRLADWGCVSGARKYHDAIAFALKTYNKGSPFLHRRLFESVKELGDYLENGSAGLEDAGEGDAGSWLGGMLKRPTLDSIWGSIEGKLNKFVSGEETMQKDSAAETAADSTTMRRRSSVDEISPWSANSPIPNTGATDRRAKRLTMPAGLFSGAIRNTFMRTASPTTTPTSLSERTQSPASAKSTPPLLPQCASPAPSMDGSAALHSMHSLPTAYGRLTTSPSMSPNMAPNGGTSSSVCSPVAEPYSVASSVSTPSTEANMGVATIPSLDNGLCEKENGMGACLDSGNGGSELSLDMSSVEVDALPLDSGEEMERRLVPEQTDDNREDYFSGFAGVNENYAQDNAISPLVWEQQGPLEPPEVQGAPEPLDNAPPQQGSPWPTIPVIDVSDENGLPQPPSVPQQPPPGFTPTISAKAMGADQSPSMLQTVPEEREEDLSEFEDEDTPWWNRPQQLGVGSMPTATRSAANLVEPVPAQNNSLAPTAHDKRAFRRSVADFGDIDDLGLDNSAFSRSRVSATAEDSQEVSSSRTSGEFSRRDNIGGIKEGKSAWRLLNFFGRRKQNDPVVADLGEENQFYYDEVQKRWVNKKSASTGDDSNPPALSPPPPPPPSTASSTSTSSSKRKPRPLSVPVFVGGVPHTGPFAPPPTKTSSDDSSTARSSGNPTGFGGGPTGRRGVRSRYVDVFNQS